MDPVNKVLGRRGLEEKGRVRRMLAEETLKRAEPYTPFLTGDLENSGHILDGYPKSFPIEYTVPYAKRQYYTGRAPGQSAYGPLRGRFWFARLKADQLPDILATVAAEAGGKPVNG